MYKKSSENFVHEENCNYLPDVTFLFFNFSLNDGIDFLINTEDNSDIESSSDEDNHDLDMLPPIEKANSETDMNSDAPDNMNDGLAHHSPRRLLNSICDSSLLDKGNKQKSVQRTQPPNTKSGKSAARNSKKGTDLQPTLKLLEASVVREEWKEIIKSPNDAFKPMFFDDLVLHVTSQTNLYAVQHGKGNLNILKDEIGLLLQFYCRQVIAKFHIEIFIGQMHLTHNEAVSCAMSRYRFREILSNLHLTDNTQITEDRYYKVRVLFEKLNFNFKQYGSFVNQSVGETIFPYYGQHGTKQFIRGKPIRFGFKLWCITSSEGYLLHAEPYCGADTDLLDTGLGHGADVALGLIEKCEVKAGSTATFDNLFTSLPLLDELTELGIGAIGALQQNRFHGAPVTNKTTLAKKPRGSNDFATDGKNLVVSWLNYKVVTCATNCVTCNSVTTAQRWSKSAKKQVDVPMLKAFGDCNK